VIEMRLVRWTTLAAATGAAVISTSVALGVGPWPGLAAAVRSPSGDVRYTASRSDGSTVVRALRAAAKGGVVAHVTLDGLWGIPAITSIGAAGGLSPDGRMLVLSEPASYSGLRSQSRFLVLSARTLAVEKTIVLGGEFGFDVLSPDRRTLYVIQHRSRADLVSYVVRAYDLARNRLLPGTIVAKGETGSMRGYPVSRASSKGGSWVYTLYHRGSGDPFIHALNTVGRSAVCIDLPHVIEGDVWSMRLSVSPDGRRLMVRSGGTAIAAVDIKTLRVL
jgi:hypothetical protein